MADAVPARRRRRRPRERAARALVGGPRPERPRRRDDPLHAPGGPEGRRVELKTEESKATLPLPRSTAVMLLEHKARRRRRRAAGVRVRDADGPAARAAQRAAGAVPGAGARPRRGWAADIPGAVRARRARAPGRRRGRRLRAARVQAPGAARCRTSTRSGTARRWIATTPKRRATCCATGTSNVTRAIYRAHFGDRRREALRARMETRMETTGDMDAGRDRGDGAQKRGIGGARK